MKIHRKNAGYILEPVVCCGCHGEYKQRRKMMAKLIKKGFGKLVSVEPNDTQKAGKAWGWRKKHEGFFGIINLYQSERKHPGKYFIGIYDIDLQYLKTSAGDLTTDGNRMTLTTNNSKYIFAWLEIEEKDGE